MLTTKCSAKPWKKWQSNGILIKVPSIEFPSVFALWLRTSKGNSPRIYITQIMCHVANAITTIKINMYIHGLRYHHGADIISTEIHLIATVRDYIRIPQWTRRAHSFVENISNTHMSIGTVAHCLFFDGPEPHIQKNSLDHRSICGQSNLEWLNSMPIVRNNLKLVSVQTCNTHSQLDHITHLSTLWGESLDSNTVIAKIASKLNGFWKSRFSLKWCVFV